MIPVKGSGGAKVAVTPSSVRPRQTVRVTIDTDEPIDEVTSARLDWGYVNFYEYHLADGVDSVDQVGTSCGGDRDTDDWVSVIVEDIPVADGQFAGTSSTFRIPSWAPASSPSIARWECRLTIDRRGPDVHANGEFTVAIGSADVDDYAEPLEVVSGAGETTIDITMTTAVHCAGEVITGQVTLTPTINLPTGDLAVSWQRERGSHPLTRTASASGGLDGRIMQLGSRIPLQAGTPVVFDFEIPLPADAPPTAAAVHSSMDWFVQARLMYSGSDTHLPERVRRPIIVVNAP